MTSSDDGRHTPSAVLSACPGVPGQAGGHRGLSSPRFTAEPSADHQRPGGRRGAQARGQPRYPELLKVKLPSTRTEADGRWARGACPAGGRSQPGTGQQADGEDCSSGWKLPKAWNVDGTCDERLSIRGAPGLGLISFSFVLKLHEGCWEACEFDGLPGKCWAVHHQETQRCTCQRLWTTV